MSDARKERLKVLVSNLEEIKGRHTELVTVYVPAGFNLNVVANQIKEERGTAQNIKSKTVRKNVTTALDKISHHLKLYKQTPKNGLAIFCGNISEKEGVSDVEIWAIEPPEPIKTRLYRCDQKFLLDPLKHMVREKEVYGLIVLDKSEAEIGVLKGKKIMSLNHLESVVPGKTKKGGQSSARFARVREGLLVDFLKRVGELASRSFKKLEDLKGVIIGGPGYIAEKFVDEEYLNYKIKKKVLGTVSTSYTGEYGLRETVERSEKLLEKASIMAEKKILDRYFDEFAKDTGLALYGIKEVAKALKLGGVDTLLLSDKFDWVKAKLKCESGHEEEKLIEKHKIKEEKCPKCGKKVSAVKEKDLADELIKMAENTSSDVVMVSTQTQKGVQLSELGGVGAILRFKM